MKAHTAAAVQRSIEPNAGSDDSGSNENCVDLSNMPKPNPSEADVAIVGGGVAGSALALELARGGLSVCLLEKTSRHEDNVRGEFLLPWGVAVARDLGILATLENAGANYTRWAVPYGEGLKPATARRLRKDISAVLPGVNGALNIEHRILCQVLNDAAEAAGAILQRNVANIEFTEGQQPTLRYSRDGATVELEPRIVVGADGRNSTIARQAGVRQIRNDPSVYLTGMLVDHMASWPEDEQTIAADDGLTLYVFPQGRGKARLYVAHPRHAFMTQSPEQKASFFLQLFDRPCMPDAIRTARPAGPCISYTNATSFSDRVSGRGFVLIGDAAGYTDPCGGQGLGCAFDDVLQVTLALRSSSEWDADAFRAYDQHRAERTRRILFLTTLLAQIREPSGARGAAYRAELAARMVKDPSLSLPLLALQKGVFAVGAEMFSPETRARFDLPPPTGLAMPGGAL